MANWYTSLKIANSNISIKVTEVEQLLFSIIKAGRDANAPGVELRIAGGWIRDRILGKLSDDIDIAVTGGDGNKIAEAIRQYDVKTSGGSHTKPPYSVSLEKTQDNSKKTSAGLRVGAIDINGMKIEFVPMRTEKYDENSRIPEIAATDNPREDVKRRDLTINAIYYNIDTGQVEDYCGGVEDLRTGVLRTPVDPVITLKEDPLRALRALRFLSQLHGFELSEDLVEALSHPEVHQAYLAKVAPERARKELEKMVLGKRPSEAVRRLFSTGLYMPVFNSDALKEFKPITMSQNTPHHKHNLLEHTVHVVKNVNDMLLESGVPERERLVTVLAAMFHDFGKMDPAIETPSKTSPGASSYPGHENVSAELVDQILKRLGFGKERELVTKIVKEHMRPHGELNSPKSIGKFLRGFEDMPIQDEMKSRLWWLTSIHALADSMSKGGIDYEDDVSSHRLQMKSIQDFIGERAKVGPKSLLDGREIIALFPNKNPKTGFIVEMQKAVMEAQDAGEVMDKESAISFLKKTFE